MSRSTAYIGHGTIKKLKDILYSLSVKRIFLVTGRKSYTLSGAEKEIGTLASDFHITRYSDFEINPKVEDVEKGIALYKRENPDCIAAVGGGSVIDTAKLLRFYAENNLIPLEKPVSGIIKYFGKPLIAIPTTAGSGSETTHFAVLYQGKKKHSVAHEHILPEIAIVDPDLTMSLPHYMTAVTGMDALAQAIESYWNIWSTEESKNYSREAIKLIIRHIDTAALHPSSAVRSAMARAAHLAGKAINITKTTASHAISYPITSCLGIAHGHAVALTLPLLLEFNGMVSEEDVIDSRGVGYVQRTIKEVSELLGAKDIGEGKSILESIMDRIGLERRLSRLGICSDKDISLIIKLGFNPERVNNNPRKLTKTSLRNILNLIQ